MTKLVSRTLTTCLLACLAVPIHASFARAYCRTTTASGAPSPCPAPCETGGIPLAWFRPEITYAFHERGFPGVDQGTLRSQIALSFGAWEEVQCGGQGVGLDFRAEPELTRLESGPPSSEPDENVIVHYTVDEWAARVLEPRAFAVTAVWFDPRTGELLDADMQFNGGMDPWVVCPETGCSGGESDIRNVATHEAGHFLGLAHTNVTDATMSCSGVPGEVLKRSLARDDEQGLCAVYPPGKAFMEPSASRAKQAATCGILQADSGSDLAGCAVLLAAGASLLRSGGSRRGGSGSRAPFLQHGIQKKIS